MDIYGFQCIRGRHTALLLGFKGWPAASLCSFLLWWLTLCFTNLAMLRQVFESNLDLLTSHGGSWWLEFKAALSLSLLTCWLSPFFVSLDRESPPEERKKLNQKCKKKRRELIQTQKGKQNRRMKKWKEKKDQIARNQKTTRGQKTRNLKIKINLNQKQRTKIKLTRKLKRRKKNCKKQTGKRRRLKQNKRLQREENSNFPTGVIILLTHWPSSHPLLGPCSPYFTVWFGARRSQTNGFFQSLYLWYKTSFSCNRWK